MHPAEVLIPITMFITLGVILILFFYWSHKNKNALQETIRHSIDNGNPLTPEMLEKMARVKSPKVTDLRRGIVITAIGIAFLLAGQFKSDPEVTEALMVAGVFPLLIGLGFLLVWKLNRYED